MSQFQITGEFILLMLAIMAQVIGTFSALSNIRVDLTERMARLETDVKHMMRALGIKRRTEDEED